MKLCACLVHFKCVYPNDFPKNKVAFLKQYSTAYDIHHAQQLDKRKVHKILNKIVKTSSFYLVWFLRYLFLKLLKINKLRCRTQPQSTINECNSVNFKNTDAKFCIFSCKGIKNIGANCQKNLNFGWGALVELTWNDPTVSM